MLVKIKRLQPRDGFQIFMEDKMPKFDTIHVKKPWGGEVIFAHNERYVGKILHIKEGHRLSKQFHKVKEHQNLEF